MNNNGLAYNKLLELVEEWASEHGELVKHPHLLAKGAADYVFMELLQITEEEIDRCELS